LSTTVSCRDLDQNIQYSEAFLANIRPISLVNPEHHQKFGTIDGTVHVPLNKWLGTHRGQKQAGIIYEVQTFSPSSPAVTGQRLPNTHIMSWIQMAGWSKIASHLVARMAAAQTLY
jgi:hypothetical protein